jgi:DNA-binding transcriptional regulator YiaG
MPVCEAAVAAHVCDETAEKRLATHDVPYRYVGSGLQNVYLVGVTYYVCECGKQAAEIPAMRNLFDALGRTIVSKTSPLTGPELRFLRKRLGKKAVEFAPMVSLTPEHLSTLENSPDPVDEGRDKLVRLIYREMSDDKKLKLVFEKQQDFEKWITSIHKTGMGERIVASRLRNNQWKVEAEPVAA